MLKKAKVADKEAVEHRLLQALQHYGRCLVHSDNFDTAAVFRVCGGMERSFRIELCDKRMITPGDKRRRDALEDSLAIVKDFRWFAVNGLRCAGDISAKGGGDCLMTEADAEKRDTALRRLAIKGNAKIRLPKLGRQA